MSEAEKPLLIGFPGSNGKFSKSTMEHLEFLELYFIVELLHVGKGSEWEGTSKLWRFTKNPEKNLTAESNTGGPPNPVDFIKQCLEKHAKAGKPPDYFLLARSFSGKVIASLMKQPTFFSDDEIPNAPLGVIFSGYPLYKNSNDDKAANLGLEIPKGTHAIFISGTRDEYLKHGSTTGADETLPTADKAGGDLLKVFIGMLPCCDTTKTVMTAGKHDPLETLVAAKGEAFQTVTNAILDFAEERIGGGKKFERDDYADHYKREIAAERTTNAENKRAAENEGVPVSKKAKRG